MVDVLSLEPSDLEKFLERYRANPPSFPLEMSLADNLVEVLRKANEFVPSEAGSILLDDPRSKRQDRERNTLTFLAAFGDSAAAIIGRTIPSDSGIAGHVYQTGHAYFTSDPVNDRLFNAELDRETAYRTQSLIGIPIRIGLEVCGVLELLNRRGGVDYDTRDRDLLEIFADYISIAIQNVLDGKLAYEYAKRDNLTGLYNDRFLHSALESTIGACRAAGSDLALLFLDLDYFKHVNDTHGHLAGSQVLREVGHLLRGSIRDPGAVVARYGGDEFVIAVPGAGRAAAVQLAEQLRLAVRTAVFCRLPGEIQTTPLHLAGLTCSIGIATMHHSIPAGVDLATTKSLLLRSSDSAMYRAKESGRDRISEAPEGKILDLSSARSLTPPKGA
ncbi:MAG: sensor domain-containing diguanylate cyclase [Thermoanaerobaculia bacterium]|jgi:diguanylate cyclase (GGDEF)-like protein|nr:sensor domain-containing diguanylate cyclase [Thermoanaerobaculia bacterium]